MKKVLSLWEFKVDFTMKKMFLLALAGALAVSCGNTETKKKESEQSVHNHDHSTNVENPATTTAKSVENGVIILGSTDNMTFDTTEIRAKAGEKVTLTLKHLGKLPVNVMGHNFVLLKQGVDINTFATNAMKAKDTDYVPSDSQDVIAHTKVIGGGEETSITFVVPEKGTYDFICSFPAHASLMKGKFIAE